LSEVHVLQSNLEGGDRIDGLGVVVDDFVVLLKMGIMTSQRFPLLFYYPPQLEDFSVKQTVWVIRLLHIPLFRGRRDNSIRHQFYLLFVQGMELASATIFTDDGLPRGVRWLLL
jgi:hypothetical protein